MNQRAIRCVAYDFTDTQIQGQFMNPGDPFAAVADPNRRKLLEALRRTPSTVNSLAEILPDISRPAVSQHLRALLDANLVNVRAEGTKRIYSINKNGFDRLNVWLDQFWSG